MYSLQKKFADHIFLQNWGRKCKKEWEIPFYNTSADSEITVEAQSGSIEHCFISLGPAQVEISTQINLTSGKSTG
jgi:hypothetical protein